MCKQLLCFRQVNAEKLFQGRECFQIVILIVAEQRHSGSFDRFRHFGRKNHCYRKSLCFKCLCGQLCLTLREIIEYDAGNCLNQRLCFCESNAKLLVQHLHRLDFADTVGVQTQRELLGHTVAQIQQMCIRTGFTQFIHKGKR